MVTGSIENTDRNAPVLGVILVGGASRRYGHDKAMARLDGAALAHRVAARVACQVGRLAASGAGRPGLDLPVIPDAVPYGGPLSALLSVLAWADGHGLDLVATFSCDTPFLPPDLVTRLGYALDADSDCAVAFHCGASHPTCALWRTAALPKIRAAFEAGIRSLHGALARLKASFAAFPEIGGGPGGDPFFNINSQADMAEAQAWIHRNRVTPCAEWNPGAMEDMRFPGKIQGRASLREDFS